MEQLILSPEKTPEIFLLGRSMELAMLSKKVKIKLSIEQFKSLVSLMTQYIYRHPITTLGDKATIFHLVKIETRVRPKIFLPKKDFILNMDIAQSMALSQMFCNLNLDGYPYEQTLCDYITGEIDHQTV